MPRREALGDVRADEAGATGEKVAHARRATSFERVEVFADYLEDMLANTARERCATTAFMTCAS